jgi:hypothetical protein
MFILSSGAARFYKNFQNPKIYLISYIFRLIFTYGNIFHIIKQYNQITTFIYCYYV